jgi:hypothetical protein
MYGSAIDGIFAICDSSASNRLITSFGMSVGAE